MVLLRSNFRSGGVDSNKDVFEIYLRRQQRLDVGNRKLKMDYSLRFYSHTKSSKNKLSTAFSDVSDDAKLTAWHQVPRMPTYNDVYNLSPQDPDIIRDRTQGGWPRPVIPITPAQKKGKIKKGHLDTLKNEYSAVDVVGDEDWGRKYSGVHQEAERRIQGLGSGTADAGFSSEQRNGMGRGDFKVNEMLKTAKIDGLRMSRIDE